LAAKLPAGVLDNSEPGNVPSGTVGSAGNTVIFRLVEPRGVVMLSSVGVPCAETKSVGMVTINTLSLLPASNFGTVVPEKDKTVEESGPKFCPSMVMDAPTVNGPEETELITGGPPGPPVESWSS